MDSQLHNLRKRGATQLLRLQEAASAINAQSTSPTASPVVTNADAAHRLRKVTLLYHEVDRAAQRLEQLTEQRRERLRQLTRQRALEDEISEVSGGIC